MEAKLHRRCKWMIYPPNLLLCNGQRTRCYVMLRHRCYATSVFFFFFFFFSFFFFISWGAAARLNRVMYQSFLKGSRFDWCDGCCLPLGPGCEVDNTRTTNRD